MEPSVTESLTFSTGIQAKLLHVSAGGDLRDILEYLGVSNPRPVLVIVGGASRISEEDQARVRSLFVKVLAPLAQMLDATVIDGGTDSGIMSMMGRARTKTRSTFPLIGVAPIGMTILPDQPSPHPDAAALEPNHTHFVLVPGDYWGAESAWMARLASALAQHCPSVTILINGGEVTWNDAKQNVEVGRHLIVVAGSGRTADALAEALRGKMTDERARRLVASGLMQAVDLRSATKLETVIREILQTECR
jgi:hypothetical protein